jgi:hypothetical protein
VVDFVKWIIRGCNISFIESHPDLDFIGSYHCATAEAIPKKKAHFRGLDFILYDSGLLKIQGSLHKYKNIGVHNYDDFSFLDLVEVLNDISTKFKLPLDDCILRNFEVGVNINQGNSPKSLLNRLLLHKYVAFKDVSRSNGHIMQAEHSQYIVKIYDKGKQYNLPFHCMRIELKFTRMEKLNRIGIRTLTDLIDPIIFHTLKKIVLNVWDDVLLFEYPLIENMLSNIERNKKQYQWRNKECWLSLTKQERYRQRKKYKLFVDRHTKNVHAIIAVKIENKFDKLISNDYLFTV